MKLVFMFVVLRSPDDGTFLRATVRSLGARSANFVHLFLILARKSTNTQSTRLSLEALINVHSFNALERQRSNTGTKHHETFEIKSASSSDRDVFEALTRDESDLVIDLNGFSRGERSSAMSSVPVSATYVGFRPPRVDCMISPLRTVSQRPSRFRVIYDESLLLFTSSSYMVSSHADAYPISHDFSINTITKQEHRDSIDRILELKRQGRLILCNFGQLYKITPNMVSAWADIMRSLPHSILWMVRHKSMNDRSLRNLRLELAMRGIDAKRCYRFAAVRSGASYRNQTIGRFIFGFVSLCRTSTAVDILWSGVPHITLEEMTPSRVASSLLHSLNMSELVTKMFVNTLTLD